MSAASDPIYSSDDAGSGLLNPAWSSVPSWTSNVFDGLGRQVAQVDNSYGNELRRTITNYYGDHHEVVPPSGGKTVYHTDLEARVTKIEEWVGSTTQQAVGPKAPDDAASGTSSGAKASSKEAEPEPTSSSAETSRESSDRDAEAGTTKAEAATDAQAALKTAAKHGKRVQVDAATTESSVMYANPDGKTFTTEITSGPTRVLQQGEWVPIDTSLVEASGVLRPKAAVAQVEFSAGGTGAFAKMTRKDGTVFALEWPTALPRPKVTGNTATYDLGDGAELVVIALPTGFRHDVVLRQRPAKPVEYRLPVLTSGLTLAVAKGGGLTLTDAKGKIAASAPEPVALDADAVKSRVPGDGKRGKITTSVVTENGRQVLVLRPDFAFLSDPTTVYPLRVDPTTTLPVNDDVDVSSIFGGGYPANPTFLAGTQTGNAKTRVYLRFNTSSLTGSTISDAKLEVMNIDAPTCGTSVGAGIQARRLTSAWSASTLTWANKPTDTTEDAVTTTKAFQNGCGTGAGYLDWTITGIVADWVAGAANHGVALQSPSETNTDNWRVFTSSEESGEFNSPPKLTVTSSGPASAPTVSALSITPSNAGAVTSVRPTLHATVSDTAAGSLRADYEIEHDPAYTQEGTGRIWSGSSAAVASGSDAPLAVPAGQLTDGWHLRWRARAANPSAATTSAWSAWQTVTVTVPDPVADQLQVTPSQTAGQVTTVTSLTPTFGARVTDPTGGMARAEFQVEHDPADTAHGTGSIWTGTTADVASGTQASVSIPAGKLSDGWQVRWRTRAVAEGTNTSAWSAWQTFTVDAPKPVVSQQQVTPSQLVDGNLVTPSLTPALAVMVTDPAGAPLRAEFEVEHDPADTAHGSGSIWTGSVDNAASGTKASVTVPADKLSDGWKVRWRARATNTGQSLSSPWSAWQTFTVDVPKPTVGQLQAVPSTQVGGETVTSTLTPELRATVTEPGGASVRAEFEVEHDPAAPGGQGSGQIWTGNVDNVASGSQATISVPAGKLTDGWKVRWRARAVNTATTTASAWSDWQNLTVTLAPSGDEPGIDLLQVTPSTVQDGVTVTSSVTPSLAGRVVNPAGGMLRAEFEVEHDPADTAHGTGSIWTGAVDDVAANNQAVVAIPAGKLSDGWKVRWRARAVAGATTSGWSDWQSLTVDVPDPGVSQVHVTPAKVIDGNTITSTLTPTLHATLTDPSGGTLRGEFEVEHDPADTAHGTGSIWTGAVDNVASGGDGTVILPAGRLSDGWKLRWRVRAVASGGTSAWSGWQTFGVDLPDPELGALEVIPSEVVDGVRVSSTLTPQLLVHVTDPAGGALRAEFEVEHDPADITHGTGAIWSGAVDNVASGTKAAIVVPAGKLANGWKVRWRVRAVGSGGTSAWSGWQALTVTDVPQVPTIENPRTQPASGGVTMTLTPALMAKVTLPQGGQLGAEFEVEHDPTDTQHGSGQIWTTAVEGVTSGANAAVTIPDGKLSDGWKIRWRARAVKGSNRSDWTPWQVVTVAAPDFHSTTYEYDLKGQLIKQTDANGNVRTFTYDLLGRKLTTHDPDAGDGQISYDEAGRVTWSTDGRGQKISYTYDDLDRRTAQWAGEASSGTKLAEWVYDTLAKGEVTSATRFTGGKAYTTRVTGYDAMTRPTGSTLSIPSVTGEEALAGDYTFTSEYNTAGIQYQIGMPAAAGLPSETVTSSFTDLGYGFGLTSNLGGGTTYVKSTSYSATGLLNGRSYGPNEQVKRSMLWDITTGRLMNVTTLAKADTATPVTAQNDEFSYNIDDTINRILDKTSAVSGGTPGQAECFTYDGLHRLSAAWTTTAESCGTSAASGDGLGIDPYAHYYTYDAVGNLLTLTDDGQTSTYRYASAGAASVRPNAVTSIDRPGGSDTYSYDDSGQMTGRIVAGKDATLQWDELGQLTKATVDGSDTTMVYDADGNRLIRRDGAKTVLYLGSMELELAAGTLTAKRYYTAPDGSVVAMRSGSGSGGLTWLASGLHGSEQIAVNDADGQVSRERYLPFGRRRGADDLPFTDRGFLGKVEDDSTGLSYLSARYYDSSIGKFISTDPLMAVMVPQMANPYSYAANNPIGMSDPTGLMPEDYGRGQNGGVKGWREDTAAAKAGRKIRPHDHYKPVGKHSATKPKRRANAAGNFAGGAFKAGWSMLCILCQAILGDLNDRGVGPTWDGLADKPLEEAGVDSGSGWYQAGYWGTTIGSSFIGGGAAAGAKAAGAGIKAAGAGIKAAGRGIKAAAGRLFGRGCPGNSFTPDTEVVMADGAGKPIEEVEVGDEVIATDPETGETAVKPVMALITGEGDKHLVQITVDTDGDQGDKSGLVIATDGHPFWVAELGQWVDAKHLDPGMWLRTSAGTYVQVESIKKWTAHHQRVHNLTIADLHTYYVLTGAAPVLVHNCNGAEIALKYKNGWTAEQMAAADAKVAALNHQANNGGLFVTDAASARGSTSAADLWRGAGKNIPENADIDHLVDLQLGGADNVSNLWPLDFSVNRSLGPQIDRQIKRLGLRIGDQVCKVTIAPRC